MSLLTARAHAAQWTTFVILGGLSATLGLLAGHLLSPGVEYPELWLLMGAVLAVGAGPLLVDALRGHFELLSLRTVFVLYILLQFVLWPAWIMASGQRSSGTIPLTFLSTRYTAALSGMTITAAGLALFHLVCRVFGPRGNGRLPTTPPGHGLRLARAQTYGAVAVLSLAAVLSFYSLVQSQGGLVPFLLNIDRFRTTSLLGKGYLFYGMGLLQVGFLLTYSARLRQGDFQKLSVVLGVGAVLVGLMGAFRHMAVETVAIWVVLSHYGRKRIRLGWKAGLAVVTFVVINIAYVSFRSSQGDATAMFREAPSVTDLLYRGLVMRFHGVESVARIIDAGEQVEASGARHFLSGLLTFWIPRFLWPDKPASFGAVGNVVFFGEAFTEGTSTGAAVPSLVGSCYWIGGTAGVLIGMALMGMLVGASERFLRARPDLVGLSLYGQVFTFTLYVNESLDTHLARFIVRLVVWWAVLLCCARVPRTHWPDSLRRRGQGQPVWSAGHPPAYR